MNTKLMLCIFLLSITTLVKANTTGINVTDTITNAVIDVEYKPEDHSGFIWKDELELARVIPTSDGKGIRITLPNADPAKVIILDKKGRKNLKSILYVAPAVIDISELRNGAYQLIIQSHNETVVKMFTKTKPGKKNK